MKGLLATLGLVPIQYASRKGRDQVCSCLSGRRGLQKAKNESNVALDALLFQNLGCLNALPGSGQLDEDSIFADAHFLVHLDDAPGSLDAGLGIIAQTNVDLGRDATLDQSGQLGTQIYRQFVHGKIDFGFEIGHGGVSASELLFGVHDGIGNHVLVAFVAVGTRLADEEGIGRGIGHETGLGVFFDHVQVAAVDGDGGHFGEFFESGSSGSGRHGKTRRSTIDWSCECHECLATLMVGQKAHQRHGKESETASEHCR
mmetsp:Transcript_3353/g.7968  ORF Transcript_3353/g.7968 Transcript_3353/m.7968 type:complete len:258 (+) Transcript_3353:532-1305(+)